MDILSRIESVMYQCPNQLYRMCKLRTNEERNCVLPRCCGICNEVLSCVGRCRFIKTHVLELEQYGGGNSI